MESQDVRSSSALITASTDAARGGADDSPTQRGRGVVGRGARYLAYLLTGLPVAIASFTLLLCGIAVSAALAVVWIGIPLAHATVDAARQLARFELSRLRYVGMHLNAPQPRVARDRRAWRELAHGLVVLPLSVVTFSVAVTWTAGAVGGLTSWLWSTWLPAASVTVGELLGFALGGPWSDTLVGLFFAGTAVPVLRACVLVHAAVATALLSDQRRN